jgi:hypothetical protein
MSKRGASLELVGKAENSNGDLPEAITARLDSLSNAHANFRATDAFKANAIAKADQKLKAQEKKRAKHMSARKKARENAAEERCKSLELLNAMLQDPESPVHPVLRAVLLAPSAGTGSLENSNTFEGINRLGSDLMALNGQLESQEEPMPAALISQIFDYQRQTFQTQLRYGSTIPNTGLIPGAGRRVASWHSSGVAEYAPQPTLTLPVDQATLNAVSPSGYNSHYVFANQGARIVDHFGRSAPIELAQQDFVPEIGDLELPLPAASLDAPNTSRPFVYYDKHDGDVEIIELPKVLGVGDTVTAAIGSNAVSHLLIGLNSENFNMNAEQRRVVRNMSLTIANKGLRLAIKRRDFLRKALAD